MEDMVIILLIIVFAIVLAVMLWILMGYRTTASQIKEEKAKLLDKYQGIINIDSEVQKRRQNAIEIQNQISNIQNEHNIKIQSLNAQYIQSKQMYDNLKKELALLEETLDIQEYGLYKPHYDYSSSEEFKAEIDKNYEQQKMVVKEGRAAFCPTEWKVGESRREGERMVNQNIRLILRAFNGECDSAIVKVGWNNIIVMEERIKKAYETINKFGTTLRISITHDYLNLKMQELRLYFEYQEKLHQEKEEQRRIQEQIREEERAQREFEKAREEAEDEEKRYQKALLKARLEMETAKGKELSALNAKVIELEEQLKIAQEMKQRAISQAQLTKSGYVYIISNIGSFGENVFKIGLTRRLEPMDRIKELGDASVPFQFDVHAMIYSDNAPELERKIHEHFNNGQINLVNDRKEFYDVSIDNIEKYCLQNNFKCTLIKIPEAREYRESLAMKRQMQERPIVEVVPEPTKQFPESLF